MNGWELDKLGDWCLAVTIPTAAIFEEISAQKVGHKKREENGAFKKTSVGWLGLCEVANYSARQPVTSPLVFPRNGGVDQRSAAADQMTQFTKSGQKTAVTTSRRFARCWSAPPI